MLIQCFISIFKFLGIKHGSYDMEFNSDPQEYANFIMSAVSGSAFARSHWKVDKLTEEISF